MEIYKIIFYKNEWNLFRLAFTQKNVMKLFSPEQIVIKCFVDFWDKGSETGILMSAIWLGLLYFIWTANRLTRVIWSYIDLLMCRHILLFTNLVPRSPDLSIISRSLYRIKFHKLLFTKVVFNSNKYTCKWRNIFRKIDRYIQVYCSIRAHSCPSSCVVRW